MKRKVMQKKNLFMLSIFILAGIILCGNQKANASLWAGITPAAYGSTEYGFPPVIIEQGDTTVYEFTFQGTFGSSDDCDLVPYVKIKPDFAPEDVFLSLDPVEFVTEREWEVQHINAGETLSFPFTVYVSNPRLEPTLPGEYYRLRAAWSPYLVDTGGGIGIRTEVRGIIKMQVIPEPATIAFLAFGGMLLRKRKS